MDSVAAIYNLGIRFSTWAVPADESIEEPEASVSGNYPEIAERWENDLLNSSTELSQVEMAERLITGFPGINNDATFFSGNPGLIAFTRNYILRRLSEFAQQPRVANHLETLRSDFRGDDYSLCLDVMDYSSRTRFAWAGVSKFSWRFSNLAIEKQRYFRTLPLLVAAIGGIAAISMGVAGVIDMPGYVYVGASAVTMTGCLYLTCLTGVAYKRSGREYL